MKDTFKFIDTHGLPLAYVVEAANRHGIKIDWPKFVRDALKAKWKPEKIQAVIEEARADIISVQSHSSHLF